MARPPTAAQHLSPARCAGRLRGSDEPHLASQIDPSTDMLSMRTGASLEWHALALSQAGPAGSPASNLRRKAHRLRPLRRATEACGGVSVRKELRRRRTATGAARLEPPMKRKLYIVHWQKGYRRVAHCGATAGSFRDRSAKAFHDSRQATYCPECSRLAQQAVGRQLVEDWWADRLKSVTPLDPRPLTR